ncbi:hypothetical protein OIV83_000880 [Microbotryomycetes sp. JL201]|nr:hypothetical protein OIV83_000880 [Microbotryomycetes sp. JL201]
MYAAELDSARQATAGGIVHGPERPPELPGRVLRPKEADLAASGVAGASAEAGLSAGGSAASKSKKRRKKKPAAAPQKTGWEPDYITPPPHQADINRYDPTLPYGLRMLRAIDEFRSLRKLTSDQALNLRWTLEQFELVATELRRQYGPQALCGVVPDSDPEYVDPDSDDEGDDDNASVTSSNGDQNADDGKLEEIDQVQQDKAEDDWAARCFAEPKIANWLHSRFNDFYTPTLSVAPVVMGAFVRFLLQRNVLPRHKAKLEAVLPLTALAEAQMPAAGPLGRQFPTLLMQSSKLLFPNLDASIETPLSDEQLVDEEQKIIPDLISSADFIKETTDVGLDNDTQVVNVDGWDDPHDGETDETRQKISEQVNRLKDMHKRIEHEHQAAEMWKSLEVSRGQALRCFKDLLLHVGCDPAVAGAWRVLTLERSARSVISWSLIKPNHQPAVPAQPDTRHIIKIDLSPHHADFPLTSWSKSNPDLATNVNDTLTQPISVMFDLTTVSVSSHLVKHVVYESDLVQLVFTPSPSLSHSFSGPTTIWVPWMVYRVLPSYYKLIDKEVLRDDPGRQLDFDPGWQVDLDERTQGIIAAFDKYRVTDDDGETRTITGEAVNGHPLNEEVETA